MGGGTLYGMTPAKQHQGLSPRGRGNPVDLELPLQHRGSIPAWAGEPTRLASVNLLREVYPRVGGGTYNLATQEQEAEGLSPRGRGNQCVGMRERGDIRSIPAWAGEPAWIGSYPRRSRVYPRVGGGTIRKAMRVGNIHGLSPRGRGNPVVAVAPFPRRWVYPRVGRGNPHGRVRKVPKVGSIPAWAGEPVPPSTSMSMRTVYPRVGGGTLGRLPQPFLESGLSPRGRGNPIVRNPWCAVPTVYPRVGGGTAEAGRWPL